MRAVNFLLNYHPDFVTTIYNMYLFGLNPKISNEKHTQAFKTYTFK